MADSVTQSEEKSGNDMAGIAEAILEKPAQDNDDVYDREHTAAIIWTPRFIITFTLMIVVGLSMGSLFVQGWANGYYPEEDVFLGYSVLSLACLIAITIVARSFWARLGAIFGSIWAVFIGFNAVIGLYNLNSNLVIAAHVNAATACALLGGYICFSIESVPFHRWDNWFFRLVPIVCVTIVAIGYFLAPPAMSVPGSLENTLTQIILALCVAIWWIRPSCWKTHPGPTFIFGLASLIQLLLRPPDGPKDQIYFFLSQVILLCMLLGIIRILQYHLRQQATAKILKGVEKKGMMPGI